uniref:PDZ domain-containing protein n=2 Tax=Guillardia theta TaxID=55529 RepID=A0A7S4PKN5_GUITH
MGNQMWEKNTMEGVMASVHSVGLLRKKIKIRFERDPVLSSLVCFDSQDARDTSRVDLPRALISVEKARIRIQETATETFEVSLPLPGKDKRFLRDKNLFDGELPYGLKLVQVAAEDGTTAVEVASIMPEGTAAASSLLRVGDRIVATQSSVGNGMWPKTTLEGILSAVRTRMDSNIRIKVARKVNLGAWEQSSMDVIKASPTDKIPYLTTSGAGANLRAEARTGSEASTLQGKRSTLGTSLAVLPDGKGWDVVQKIRQVHDRQVDKWPPHLILLRPFVRGEDFAVASSLLLEALEGTEPFELRMELTVKVYHNRSASVWLVPVGESRDCVLELQAQAAEIFPQCVRRGSKLFDYTPHLTLGQFPSESAARVFVALVQDSFANFSFSVSHLFLLSRQDRSSAGVDQLRIKLGRRGLMGTPVSVAASEYGVLRRAGAELNSSTMRSVLLERSSFDLLAYGKQGNLSAIESIVKELKENEVEIDSKLLNIIMGSYILCDRPASAVEAFSYFSSSQHPPSLRPSVHCYGTLIKAYGQLGQLEAAFETLNGMVKGGPAPSIRVINALLQACVRAGNLTAAQTLFSSLRGVRGEGFANFLTPATEAGLCISLQPTGVSFNIMVNAYARRRKVEKAFKMLLEMRRAGCKPDQITYTTLVKACVAAGQFDRAERLLGEMEELGIPPNAYSYNCILYGLAQKLQWGKATRLLQRMEEDGVEANLLSYSYCILACVRARRMKEASALFEEMRRKGIVPNLFVMNTMMSGYAAKGMVDEAQGIMKLLQDMRIKANAMTFSSLIEAFINAGYADKAVEVKRKMEELGVEVDMVVSTQMLKAYTSMGKVEEAIEKLEEIVKEASSPVSSRTFDSVLFQCSKRGSKEEALRVLGLMLRSRVTPSRTTCQLLSRMEKLQGSILTQYLLDVISLLRSHSVRPPGPLYLAVLRASLDAGETELATMVVEERILGKFSVSKQDEEEAEKLEMRMMNLLQASKGNWYDRPGVGKRMGRLGSYFSGKMEGQWGGRTSSLSSSPARSRGYEEEWEYFNDQAYSRGGTGVGAESSGTYDDWM